MANNTPVAVIPRYKMSKVNEELIMYEGDLQIVQGDVTIEGEGRVFISWLPLPNLRWEVKAPGVCMDFKQTSATLEAPSQPDLTLNNVRIYGFTVRDHGPETSSTTVRGGMSHATRGTADEVSAVHFHVPNFRSEGAPITSVEDGLERFWVGRSETASDGWVVTIDAVHSIRDREEELRQFGGYAFTHAGTIALEDGSLFAPPHAYDVLEALSMLLTFARGRKTNAMVYTGTVADDVVWEEWSVPTVDPYQGWEESDSWFQRSSPALATIFPNFFERWREPTWQEAMSLAVDFYTSANAADPQISLVVGQSCLELLAWTVLVEHRKTLTEKGFNDLRSSDQIRLLLERCGIPLAIPPSLNALTVEASNQSWVDGPHAITALRNSVVHPVSKRRSTASSVALPWFDAAQLNGWYVELVLLRLLRYTDDYSPRVVFGRDSFYTEPVPWGNEDQPLI